MGMSTLHLSGEGTNTLSGGDFCFPALDNCCHLEIQASVTWSSVLSRNAEKSRFSKMNFEFKFKWNVAADVEDVE